MAAEGISLNKYISATGFCSRRAADKLIEQARVTINGELVLPGARVYAGDRVDVDGEPVKMKQQARPIYLVLNKPVGVTSTTDLKDATNIISFMNFPKRIFPVGRLDKDSDGLIILTNDGDIVNKILRAANNHEKEYVVTVDQAITPEFIRGMGEGVPILGTKTKKCFIRQEGGRRFRIVLTQGLNRQIRRMCEYFGYKVQTLTRVRIMNLQLGDLPVGKWRYLTAAEIDKMNELVASSTKTESAADKKRNRPAGPVKRLTDKSTTGQQSQKVKASKGAKPTNRVPNGRGTAKQTPQPKRK
jgi:23S rRNA pseudouridine2604 synthase